MIDIIIAVGVCSGIAVVCGVLLTIASLVFAVKEDEKYLAVRDALPGANCGACGFSGCDAYAKALSEGNTDKTNLCIPGGSKAATDIASTLGVEAAEAVKRYAYVSCNGNCEAAQKKDFEYHGTKTCKAAAESFGGEKLCSYACIGYGDCAVACPEDAIAVVNGVAKVISEKCMGCGICAKACPMGIVKLINANAKVAVACSNHDKGAITRKMCTNGCIGCAKCVKTCPNGAISMEDNLAVIDYEKCTGCGACAEACPVHGIRADVYSCSACV